MYQGGDTPRRTSTLISRITALSTYSDARMSVARPPREQITTHQKAIDGLLERLQARCDYRNVSVGIEQANGLATPRDPLKVIRDTDDRAT
jgi:hypothetical protein